MGKLIILLLLTINCYASSKEDLIIQQNQRYTAIETYLNGLKMQDLKLLQNEISKEEYLLNISPLMAGLDLNKEAIRRNIIKYIQDN